MLSRIRHCKFAVGSDGTECENMTGAPPPNIVLPFDWNLFCSEDERGLMRTVTVTVKRKAKGNSDEDDDEKQLLKEQVEACRGCLLLAFYC